MLNKMATLLSYAVLLCLFPFSLNCAAPPKEMRAYIDENSRWKIVENCGYENCYPMVDFLTSEDITIRIEYNPDYEKNYFVVQISMTAFKKQFFFNPSNAVAKLKSGNMLKPKGFECGLDVRQMRIRSSLHEPELIKKLNCFLIFFDYPVASVANGFTLDLNSALTLKGKEVTVPLIYFTKKKLRPKNL